jgi:hypothetical protein
MFRIDLIRKDKTALLVSRPRSWSSPSLGTKFLRVRFRERPFSVFLVRRIQAVRGVWSQRIILVNKNIYGSSPKRVGNFVPFFQLKIYIRGFSEA